MRPLPMPTVTFGQSILTERRYECPTGHKVKASATIRVHVEIDGNPTTYGPVCMACVAEWLAATFPTTEVP